MCARARVHVNPWPGSSPGWDSWNSSVPPSADSCKPLVWEVGDENGWVEAATGL